MDMIAIQYPTFQNTYNTTWLYNFALGSSPQTFPANYTCSDPSLMLQNQISCYVDEPFTPPATQAAPTNETETDNGSSSSSGDQSSSLSVGSKAGIVIGVIAGIAALGGAAFWFYRRRKPSEPSHNFYKMDDI
jgi:LPXTG-motif cell wall-anchored protein